MDRALRAMATKIIVAWGNQGRYQHRGRQVTNMLQKIGLIHSLGVTTSGHPKHLLYPKSDIVPGQCQTERLRRLNDEKLICPEGSGSALVLNASGNRSDVLISSAGVKSERPTYCRAREVFASPGS